MHEPYLFVISICILNMLQILFWDLIYHRMRATVLVLYYAFHLFCGETAISYLSRTAFVKL